MLKLNAHEEYNVISQTELKTEILGCEEVMLIKALQI
jgi:hypothetical protein